MKKIKLFIFLTMILSMTLIIAGCKNKGFGFKSQEEIVNSFKNYSIEFKVVKEGKETIYKIIEDESYIAYQINDCMMTLFQKSTKMKYIVKRNAKTKSLYISTEDIEKVVKNIKNNFFSAHVSLASDYIQQADEEVNGILCNVYSRVSEGLEQYCYVSKNEGFCVKTYVDSQGTITSYEVLSYEKDNQSNQEYFDYATVEFSLWPDHQLALVIPELRSGDYESHMSNDEFIQIVYNNVNVEDLEFYILSVKEANYTENIEENDQYGYYTFSADNKAYQILVEYYNQKITIKVQLLTE